MTGRTIFNVGVKTDHARRMRSGDEPFLILVIGDFSGRSTTSTGEMVPPAGKPIPIDIDTFDAVMARLGPSVHLADREEISDALDLSFARLDDFHPDTLFDRLPLFHDLRILRARLADPATFAETAASLKQGASAVPRRAPGAQQPSSPGEDESTMLTRLLGVRAAREVEGGDLRGGLAAALERHLHKLVSPAVLPAIEAEQTLLLGAVDDQIASLMRAVIHHPDVQRLEAAWRGLHWLINSIETDEAVEIFLLDADPASLASTDLSGLHGDRPWSLVVVERSFGPVAADLNLLSALGTIVSVRDTALLAAADPGLLGCPDLVKYPNPRDWQPLDAAMAQHWQALRRSPAAASIGLALPRVLLRLPYGARVEPIEQFAFEELTDTESHRFYLWGNPAVAAAILVARAFQERGWSMTPNDVLDLDDLPAHTFAGADGPELKPCAEVFLSDIAAEAVLARGIMPFLSHRHRNAVRLARIQSIADPPQALSGPWS